MTSRRRPPQDELRNVEAEPDGLVTRASGVWALQKLAIYSAYFRSFNRAGATAVHRNYVDGFAGPGLNRIRGTEQHVYGSPLLALRATPSFTNFLFVDGNQINTNVLRQRSAGDSRAITIELGDTNDVLTPAMYRHLDPAAPTLCVLDESGFQLSWRTVEGVARFREGPLKTELLITFALNMAILRVLSTREPMSDRDRFALDAHFGSRQWEGIYRDRLAKALEPADAAEAYLTLYKRNLEQGLGYKNVLNRAVREDGHRGRPLYQLIFATDHPAGRDIMENIFSRMRPLDPQLPLL